MIAAATAAGSALAALALWATRRRYLLVACLAAVMLLQNLATMLTLRSGVVPIGQGELLLVSKEVFAIVALALSALILLAGAVRTGTVRLSRTERLAILFPGGAVGARELEQVLPEAAASRNVRAAAWDGPDASEPMDLSSRIDAFERRLILEALEAANGSVAEAARRLRTDRPNLYRRMKRLGIER